MARVLMRGGGPLTRVSGASDLRTTGKRISMPDLPNSDPVAIFQRRLTEFSPKEVVRRYITSGPCAKVDGESYANARQRIADHFEVHHTNVFVVGSAKLGFSVAPAKRFREFNDESDIDVAIVSPELYLRVWRQLSDLLNADPGFLWEKHTLLKKKHLTGWLRPDALPPSPALPLVDEWFEFFRELTGDQVFGPYHVSAGIYYDIHFLESYQERAVAMCQMEDVS